MSIPHIGVPNIAFNANTVMVIVLILVLVYGLIMGHNKLKTFALSCFAGLVMVMTFANGLNSIVQKAHWTLGGHLGLTAVKIILFTLPVVILEFGHKEKGKNKGGFLITMILAVVTAALLISSIISFLDSGAASNILRSSILADWIYTFRLAWLVAVLVVVAAENFMPNKSH